MGAVDDLAGPDESSERECRAGVVSLTRHARKRGARRNVAPDAVEYVLAHGRLIQRTGVTFYFLGRRDIPPCDRRASWASRLEGAIVIVARDGVVITVYRDRRGLRAIARKMKYRLCTSEQAAECVEASETPTPPTLRACEAISA